MLKLNSRATLLVALLCSVSLLGCIPTDVVWMPDSSGYLYVNSSHSLVLLNLSDDNETTLATFDWLKPHEGRTAVSLDGKRFAIGRLQVAEGESEGTLTIHLLDRDGNEKPGVELDWNLNTAADKPVNESMMLEWVQTDQDEDRILAQRESIGLFDPNSGTLKQLTDLQIPFVMEQITLGVSCVTPDRKGFVAFRENDQNSQFLLVDWDGNEQEFAGMEKVLAEIEQQEKETSDAARVGLYDLQWVGDRLIVTITPDRCLRLNVKKLTASVGEPPQKIDDITKFTKTHDAEIRPFNRRVFIAMTPIDDTNNSPQRIDLISRESGEVTATIAEMASNPFCLVSPDRQRMIIRYSIPQEYGGVKGEVVTLVVGSSGKVLSTTTVVVR